MVLKDIFSEWPLYFLKLSGSEDFSLCFPSHNIDIWIFTQLVSSGHKAVFFSLILKTNIFQLLVHVSLGLFRGKDLIEYIHTYEGLYYGKWIQWAWSVVASCLAMNLCWWPHPLDMVSVAGITHYKVEGGLVHARKTMAFMYFYLYRRFPNKYLVIYLGGLIWTLPSFETWISTILHQLYAETGKQDFLLILNRKSQFQGGWWYDSEFEAQTLALQGWW